MKNIPEYHRKRIAERTANMPTALAAVMQPPRENIIRYSDGRVIYNPIIAIWDDWHAERLGFYRAYWLASPDAESGSPVVGYCSPGGSHRTIRAAATEARRLYPGTPIYRNGKEIKL